MSGTDWLDERYGRRAPGRGRTVLVAAVALVAVAGIAWAVWAATGLARATVTVHEVTVDASDPGLVRLSFEVSLPRGRTAVCSVRATDANGAVVGWADVVIPRVESGAGGAATEIRTSLPATGGGVRDCIAR
jgi:hypothetical protein